MSLETSILTATKKVLNIPETYSAFDQDVLMHLNAALSILDQLGVGPAGGFTVNDESAVWSDLSLQSNQLHLLKSYVFLKVRILFDPPGTSFALKAAENQIVEYEWRLRSMQEDLEAL